MSIRSGRPPTRRRLMIAATTVLVVALAVVVIVGIGEPVTQKGSVSQLPAQLAVGTEVFHTTPDLKLISEDGRPTSLAAFHGKWLIFAPSMTLCQEECPMTTGALMSLSEMVRRAGLASQVDIAEVTVDPWRDSPARLRAYKKLTGLNFKLLTGTLPEIRKFWKFFGIAFEKTPPDKPAPIDWWTHKPETMDVEHQDGLFFLDPAGNERIVAEGDADVGGHLSSKFLRSQLDKEGREDLAHPQLPWSASEAMEDFDWLTNREVPAAEVQDVSAPSAGQASRELADSPHPLAALHAQAGQLLGSSSEMMARVKSLRGYPIVINAWASWCTSCRQEHSVLQSVSALYGRKVAFLGLDAEDQAANARSYLQKYPSSYPSYQTSKLDLPGLASIANLPTTIFINPQGKVTYVYRGAYASVTALAANVQHYAIDSS